jgi:hypothetical protein
LDVPQFDLLEERFLVTPPTDTKLRSKSEDLSFMSRHMLVSFEERDRLSRFHLTGSYPTALVMLAITSYTVFLETTCGLLSCSFLNVGGQLGQRLILSAEV